MKAFGKIKMELKGPKKPRPEGRGASLLIRHVAL